MTLAAELRSIDCPNCGAGLSVLGGGRVTLHVCGYCGSALDAIEGYRVLRQFADLKRPASPFAIGMAGTLFGASYQVIGTLGWQESHRGVRWTWVDHLIFSPTHGYAWLTVELGHLIYTRRHRAATRPNWISPAQVESAKTKPEVYSDGQSYSYYETSTARITFAEGEFTWRPMVGDQTVTVSALSDRAMLHFVQGPTEREIDRSIYLPGRETLAAFGIAQPLTPADVHPLQPFRAGPNDGFLGMTGFGFMVLCLSLGIALMSGEESILSRQRIPAADLPVELSLPITATNRLASVTVSGKFDNSWAFVELSVTDPTNTPVFVAGREISYYSGTDSDGYWSEDNSETTLTFRPAIPGTYSVEIDVTETGSGEHISVGPTPILSVSAVQGGANAIWLFGAAFLFGTVALWTASGPYRHRLARWRGTDWTDED